MSGWQDQGLLRLTAQGTHGHGAAGLWGSVKPRFGNLDINLRSWLLIVVDWPGLHWDLQLCLHVVGPCW